MSLWEYKVITSGKGGFAAPAMMEKFLNDLGRDEWEIVCFQTSPENFLAFTGLARRSTQRDWTLEDAAAAAAKAEAEKLRAEFEAKFKAANQPAAAEERAPSFIEEKSAPDDGFRKPVDTSRDDDPEQADDEKDDWDKLTAAEEDELPTFFEAIKPHMRRNQRGPGMSVGVEYLAKKWDQSEDDLKAALAECGFVVPADEDAKVEYLEYDGDLYWLNINRRGELWINTKEKPRQIFRSVKAQKIAVEEEPARGGGDRSGGQRQAPAESAEKSDGAGERKPEADGQAENAGGGAGVVEGEAKPEGAQPENRGGGGGGGKPLPEGPELLRKIRPHMRRNRRGPGGSGSATFLARALRTNEGDLKTAFVGLGLTMPANSGDKAVYTEFGNELWWLNLDSRGGLWINGREKRAGETLTAANAASAAEPAGTQADGASGENSGGAAPASTEAAPAATTTEIPGGQEPAAAAGQDAPATPAPAPESAPSAPATAESSEHTREVAPVPAEVPAAVAATNPLLSSVRMVLKETRAGALAAKVEHVASELGKSPEHLVESLVEIGLKLPEKPREKPVYAEHAGEIFWLNKNARGELWVNAKASKLAGKDEAEPAEGDESAAVSEGGETPEASETASEGGEGDAEKKPRRTRTRNKKAD